MFILRISSFEIIQNPLTKIFHENYSFKKRARKPSNASNNHKFQINEKNQIIPNLEMQTKPSQKGTQKKKLSISNVNLSANIFLKITSFALK